MIEFANTSGVGADAGVANHAIRSDLDACAQVHLADEHGIHIDVDIAFDLDLAANIDAGGIRQGGAREHQLARFLRAVACLHLRELDFVVDAHDLGGAGRQDRIHPMFRGHRQRNHIGEVILALPIVPAQTRAAIPAGVPRAPP